MAQPRLYHAHSTGRDGECTNDLRVAGVPTEIWTEYLQNTSLDRYR
jgi:hypothetical protein